MRGGGEEKTNTEQVGHHKAIVPFGGEELNRIRIDKGSARVSAAVVFEMREVAVIFKNKTVFRSKLRRAGCFFKSYICVHQEN